MTMKRGGYDRTLYIKEDDSERKEKTIDNDNVFPRDLEKSDANTKL